MDLWSSNNETPTLPPIVQIISHVIRWWVFMILYQKVGSPDIVSWETFWLFMVATVIAALVVVVVFLIVLACLGGIDD